MKSRYMILSIIAGIVAVIITATSLDSSNSAGNGGGLLQGVKSEKESHPLGEPIKFVYAVRNTGKEPLTFTFNSSKKFDLWVKRGEKEIYRLSKGKMYAMMITTLALGPGETRTFETVWNQKGNDGKEVGPGVYDVYAQLASPKDAPPATGCSVKLGGSAPILIPVTVGVIAARGTEFAGKRVQIEGTYKGWQPPTGDPNTASGPPVTRSDWAVCDASGCIYVTGRSGLDPSTDIGARISVIGKVEKTSKGQVYLTAESVTRKKT